MFPSDDTGGWRFVPEDPCGMCGEETPKGAAHCSPACAAAYREMLDRAKGVA